MTTATRPERILPSASLRQNPVIAVLRADAPGAYDRVIHTLVESGIRSIELTLTTPGTLDHLPSLIAEFGEDAEIGVGTITRTAQARQAIEAGARFLVTPTVNPDIIRLAVDHGTQIFPGGLTPTELFGAWEAGASAVKIFPAQTVGAQYGSHLRGPFPELQFLPSGGVGIEDIPAWLRAGALAVSLGGPLVGDALRDGSLTELRARAARALAAVAETRNER
jgi:2-dehydro-3-deoxyphosphogluconate aldolase/(4S)-4-hydroxy-2-oxoglutarate aldolase